MSLAAQRSLLVAEFESVQGQRWPLEAERHHPASIPEPATVPEMVLREVVRLENLAECLLGPGLGFVPDQRKVPEVEQSRPYLVPVPAKLQAGVLREVEHRDTLALQPRFYLQVPKNQRRQ